MEMALLDDIRNHLAVMNPGQRERRGAVLLREAAAENERLSAIAPSESDSPQPVASTPAEPSTRGEGTQRSEGTSEPVAWVAFADDASESGVTALNRQAVEEVAAKMGWHVAPLYRSPTLTDAEREAVEAAARIIDAYEDEMDGFSSGAVATLRGLLERL